MNSQKSNKSDSHRESLSEMLTEILQTLGPQPRVDASRLKALADYPTAKECIEEICRVYGLPIAVHVSYLSAHYSAGATEGFRSSHIVTADKHRSQGIIAQVAIPLNLPLFGSSLMNGFKIDVRLQDNCFDYPGRFVTIMAHEIAHVLLYSLRHPQKQNEFFTDMTAIASGFGRVMRDGRKVTHTQRRGNYILTQTETVGYLSDLDFEWVLNGVEAVATQRKREIKKLMIKINAVKKSTAAAKRLKHLFDGYLQAFDPMSASPISQEESGRMARYYQSGFLERFEHDLGAILRTCDTESSIIERTTTLSAEAVRFAGLKLKNIENMQVRVAGSLNELKNETHFLASKIPASSRLRIWIKQVLLRINLRQKNH